MIIMENQSTTQISCDPRNETDNAWNVTQQLECLEYSKYIYLQKRNSRRHTTPGNRLLPIRRD